MGNKLTARYFYYWKVTRKVYFIQVCGLWGNGCTGINVLKTLPWDFHLFDEPINFPPGIVTFFVTHTKLLNLISSFALVFKTLIFQKTDILVRIWSRKKKSISVFQVWKLSVQGIWGLHYHGIDRGVKVRISADQIGFKNLLKSHREFQDPGIVTINDFSLQRQEK